MTDASGAPARIASRADFQQALRAAFAGAAEAGAPTLWLCDADFAAWPLGERGVIADLTCWVDSRRRLTLVAACFDALTRWHPRWVAWRRDWAHVVDCRTAPDREPSGWPTLMLAPGRHGVVLDDPAGFRGRVLREAADLGAARERIDAVLQHSLPAFPADVTGL